MVSHEPSPQWSVKPESEAASGTLPEPETPPELLEPTPGEVADSRSDACWSAEHPGWGAVAPDLPEEAGALLAEPLVVSVDPPDGPMGTDGAGGAAGGRAQGSDEAEGDGSDRPQAWAFLADPGARPWDRYDGRRPRFLAVAGPQSRALARHRV